MKSIDATHLLTRLRRHCSKGNVEGMSKQAWLNVAKGGRTFLSPVMVEDVIDLMSVAMARTHFSDSVENEMRINGDFQTAYFCKDVRNLWIANDDPGVPSNTRICLRSHLRERLLKGINSDSPKFPPPTSYIQGIPMLLLWT